MTHRTFTALFLALGLPAFTGDLHARNPVLRGADPHAIVVGDTVWIYPTTASGDGHFFAFSSDDLVNWETHGPILELAEIDWIPRRKHAWATE